MSGILLGQDITVPAGEVCVTWSAPAGRALPVGPRAWRALCRVAAQALQGFHATARADAAVWLWDRPWRAKRGSGDALVTMFLGSSVPIGKESLDAVGRPLGDAETGWHGNGVHPRPGDAQPLMGIIGGRMHMLWQRDTSGPYLVVLRREAEDLSRARLRLDEVSEADFLPRIGHAVGVPEVLPAHATREKRRLELAFALKMVHRIVAADGRKEPRENEFVLQQFPDALIREHGLHDPAALDAAAAKAEQLLAAMLGHHEKLALLNTFYAACAADGRVEVAEMKLLKQGAESLGLRHDEVVSYLSRIW